MKNYKAYIKDGRVQNVEEVNAHDSFPRLHILEPIPHFHLLEYFFFEAEHFMHAANLAHLFIDEDKPQFKHGCDVTPARCKFLGTFADGDTANFDLLLLQGRGQVSGCLRQIRK